MLTSHFNISSGIPIRLSAVGRKMFNNNAEQKIILVMDKDGATYIKGKKNQT